MRGKRQVKAENRAVSTLLRRRIGVVVGLVFVWATVVWVVSSFPYSRAVHGGSNVRTSYGVLRWLEVTAPHEQAGVASLLPLHTVGASRLRPTLIVTPGRVCA